MTHFVPRGFSVKGAGKEARLHNDQTGERFNLSNSRWRDTVHSLDGLPTLAIRGLLAASTGGAQIRVADLGAGSERRAAQQLQRHRKFGPHLQVIGVDLVFSGPLRAGSQIVGDVTKLPLRDDSVDLAYSMRSFSLLADGKPEVLKAGLEEVSRILTPNGIAFIDEARFSDPSYEDDDPSAVTPPGAALYSGRLGLFGALKARLTGHGHVHDRTKYDPRFLILANNGLENPIMNDLIRSGKDIRPL